MPRRRSAHAAPRALLLMTGRESERSGCHEVGPVYGFLTGHLDESNLYQYVAGSGVPVPDRGVKLRVPARPRPVQHRQRRLGRVSLPPESAQELEGQFRSLHALRTLPGSDETAVADGVATNLALYG